MSDDKQDAEVMGYVAAFNKTEFCPPVAIVTRSTLGVLVCPCWFPWMVV